MIQWTSLCPLSLYHTEVPYCPESKTVSHVYPRQGLLPEEAHAARVHVIAAPSVILLSPSLANRDYIGLNCVLSDNFLAIGSLLQDIGWFAERRPGDPCTVALGV